MVYQGNVFLGLVLKLLVDFLWLVVGVRLVIPGVLVVWSVTITKL